MTMLHDAYAALLSGVNTKKWRNKMNNTKFINSLGCYELQLTQGQVTLINKEDINLIKKYRWRARKTKKNGKYYACSGSGKNVIWLHRLLLNTPTGLVVDHINHNSLDNRRNNIRNVTHTLNMQNMRPLRNNNTGITGIYLMKNNKYLARIQINNKRISLGCFNTLNEAIIARTNAKTTN